MSNLKLNFRNGHNDLSCQLGCSNEESQKHLFECNFLLRNCQDLADNIKVEYEDIFGDIDKQIDAIKLISKMWTVRGKLINDTSA